MSLYTKDVYSLFLYCKSKITEMQCRDRINEYRDFIEETRRELDLMDLTNLNKEERLVLDKIRVYLDFAEKDVLTKLESSKNYQWRTGGI